MRFNLRFYTLLLSLFVPSLYAQTNVLTQHNDIGRTGQNTTETILTPSSVTASGFGKLFTLTVDGLVYAQPLYLSNVNIGGTTHRVVFAATEHDSVYAFDASTGAQLWQVTMTDSAHGATPGAIPEPVSDTGCGDIDELGGAAEYGITGTPVIDAATGTIYVVSVTYEGTYPVQRLHALDVTSGAEKSQSPVTIAASVPGTGMGSSTGTLNFDPKWENQRAGLLAVNGNIYIAYGAHCDFSPWHGWILGYDEVSLKQTAKFASTPNGTAGGIWISGSGLAADIQGGVARIFPVTGNGTYDSSSDYSDDILRLTPSLSVADSFTPSNQADLSSSDSDVASGGALLLPDQSGANPHLLAQLGKSGALYIVNRDNMSGFSGIGNANNIVQTVMATNGLWGLPAYWNGNLYIWPRNGALSRYPITSGTLTSSPAEISLLTVGNDGLTPSVSSSGTSNGILWAVDFTQSPQVLYAYNAANVSQLLWSSNLNTARDSAGSHQKFAVPTIADGNVFVGSNDEVLVYGLLGAATPDFAISSFPLSLSVVPGASVSTQINVSSINGFSGSLTLTASGLPPGVAASFVANSSSVATMTLTAAPTAPLTSAPLPVTITGTSGTLSHSISLSVGVSATTAPTAVNMASVYNVYGIFTNGSSITNGGLDNDGSAYSANLLGTSLIAAGMPYHFGTPNLPNAASSTTVPLPAGSYAALDFVGAGVNGNQANQAFVVTYTDGTATTFTQSVSDWFSPQSYPGETIASSMSYRLLSGGTTDSRTFDLYAYSLTLNSGKVVQSIALPPNRNVTVLAISLSPSQSATSSPTSQTISFGPISSHPVGTALTLTATTTSGLSVTFASATASVCTVSGTSLSLLSGGTCTINASQPGNSNYSAATPVSQSFSVTATATGTFTISAASASVTVTPPFFFFRGRSATDRITLTPANRFTGAVNFSITGLPTGVTASFNPTTLNSTGSTTLTLTPSSSAANNRSTTLTIKGISSTGQTSATTIALRY